MPNRIFNPWTSGTVLFLLLLGIVYAQTNRFNERVNAINKQCQADRQRLGLDQQKAEAKYPTPKITSCSLLRLAPGSTGEVVVRGTFEAGTKFLFSNDKVEVVKETLKAGTPESEYRATVKVAQGVLPDSAQLELFQPVTCSSAFCYAVYISGKYEYSFTGDNGWRVILKYAGEPEGREMGSMYHAEFYRPNESAPVQTSEIVLYCNDIHCHSDISQGAQTNSPQAELTKLMKKLSDPKLSTQEREQLTTRMNEVEKQMMQAATAPAKEKKQSGCTFVKFDVKGNSLEGVLGCDAGVGRPDPLHIYGSRVDIKGTVKFLGP